MPKAPTTTEIARENGLATFLAIGSTYTADGWTPVGDLFSFFVPFCDQAYALDYANRLRNPGAGGAATHGCHSITRVVRIDPHGRSPRNKERAESAHNWLGSLPLAPDGSRWSLEAALYKQIQLTRHADRFPPIGTTPKTEAVYLEWAELREAAKHTPWYADLLKRAEAAAYC